MPNGLTMLYEESQLKELNKHLIEQTKLEKEAANELLGIQINNAQRLLNARKDFINKEKAFRLNQEQAINEKLIAMGYDVQKVLAAKSRQDREKEIKDKYANEIKAAASPQAKAAIKRGWSKS